MKSELNLMYKIAALELLIFMLISISWFQWRISMNMLKCLKLRVAFAVFPLKKTRNLVAYPVLCNRGWYLSFWVSIYTKIPDTGVFQKLQIDGDDLLSSFLPLASQSF